MESSSKREAERLIEEQKLSASEQAHKRQEYNPGLHREDGFGQNNEPGAGKYYPEGDLLDADKAPRAGGPVQHDLAADEGSTGIGNRKPRAENPSAEELDRDTVDRR